MPISDPGVGGLYNVDNVLVGSAVGFVADIVNGAIPADPADSLTVFDPAIWVTPWLSAGGTEQGWQVNWNPSTQDIMIDEQPTPVDQQMQSATLQFVANLSEDTMQSWAWALNANKTLVVPASNVFGKTKLTPQSVLKRYKVVLETQNIGLMPRRYIVPKMTSAANVGATFRRAAGQRLVPVTFTSICKMSDIQVVDITANKTA